MEKIRFFKCSSFSPNYLEQFYAKNYENLGHDYTTHYTALMADCFGWADFWKLNLEASGRFECMEVVINAENLQKQWAREHSIKWSDAGWPLEILLAQVLDFKPHVLFTHDFATVTPAFRCRVRELTPSISLILGWDGVGHCNYLTFRGCDLMLAPAQHIVDDYQGAGLRSCLFKLGFEASILSRLANADRRIGCSFVGSIFLGAHENRFRCIAEVTRQVPIELHLSISHGRFLRSRMGLLARGNMSALWRLGKSWADYQFLCAMSLPVLFGIDMYHKLAETRIGFNIHIDASRDNSGNMRLFEVTGMGACLLTDRKHDLTKYFEEGNEIVVFDSPDDAIAKLKWLLSDTAGCARIAAAGQARTLKDHSLANSISKFANMYINN